MLTGGAVFASALAVYLATMPRSLASSDSGELTAAAATLGIPHPPGYPLYVLTGKAFSLLPAGDVAFRLNLMSAVFGALAVLAVFAIVQELTGRRIAAAAAALSLAFSHHFWGQSLVAEVYTLEAALIGGVIYALCLYRRRRNPAFLYAGFLLVGLSLAHRPSAALLFPPLLAWVLADGSIRSPAAGAKALAFVLPGLALYLFLPIAFVASGGYLWNVSYDSSANPVYVDLTTFDGLRWYVTAEIFHPLAFAYGPAGFLAEAGDFLRQLWGDFIGVGIVLGLLGVYGAWRRHPAFFQLTAGAFALITWFYISYAAGDKDQMFLSAYLIWALWIGLGAAELLSLAEAGHMRWFASWSSRALILAVPLVLLLANFSVLDFSSRSPVEDDAGRLLAAAPEGALVIGHWTDISALQYYQLVEGRRPDLTLVARWSLDSDSLGQIVGSNIDTRDIYLLADVPALRDEFRLTEVGSWFLVEPLDEGSSP